MAPIQGNVERVHRLINLLTPVYDFRKSHPDHRWKIGFLDGTAKHFTLQVSPVEIYDVTALNEEPVLSKREIETFVKPRVVRGKINGSLFLSLLEEKEATQLVSKLERVFAWDIDFYTDPRQGDRFEILIEEKFIKDGDDAVFLEYGHVLAARYFGARSDHDAFRFENNGEVGYYNSKGQSLIRAIIKQPAGVQSPVNFALRRSVNAAIPSL